MWMSLPFEKCIQKVKTPFKLPKKEYLKQGRYPVVSQEAALISGYHDDAKHLFNVDQPVVIFGDHTQVLKYIDFSFVMGADGVKILKPISDIDAKFFYYTLAALMPKGKGYARHYKLLKELYISFPPLAEQQRIVAKLDAAFEEIDRVIHSSVRSRNQLAALSRSKVKEIFAELENKSPMRPIADICEAIFAGGDAPKDSLSDTKVGKFQVPIYANAVKKKGLYGYTERARVHKPSVTVAGRGSGTGYTEIRYEPFLPIVRLIVLTPDISKVTVEFLKHAIVSLEVLSSGAAIPQLTVPMMKNYEIPVPHLDEQRAIIEKLNSLQSYVEDCTATYKTKLESLASLKSAILAQELNSSHSDAA